MVKMEKTSKESSMRLSIAHDDQYDSTFLTNDQNMFLDDDDSPASSPPSKRRRVSMTPTVTRADEANSVSLQQDRQSKQANTTSKKDEAQNLYGNIAFDEETTTDALQPSIPPNSIPIALWCADPKPRRLVFVSITYRNNTPILHFELSGVDQNYENVPFRPGMYTTPPGHAWDVTKTHNTESFSKIKFRSSLGSTGFDNVVDHVFREQKLKGASTELIWCSAEDMRQSPYIKDLFDLTTKFQASDEFTGVSMNNPAAEAFKYVQQLRAAMTQATDNVDVSYQKLMTALQSRQLTNFDRVLATTAAEMSRQSTTLLQQQIELRARNKAIEALEIPCPVEHQRTMTINLRKLGLRVVPIHDQARVIDLDGLVKLRMEVDENENIQLKDCDFEQQAEVNPYAAIFQRSLDTEAWNDCNSRPTRHT